MKQFFRTYPRAIKLLTVCLVAAAVGVATPSLLLPKSQIATATPGQSGGGPVESQPQQGELQKGTPDYETVLPAGKTIEQYGGWTRVSPPNRNPVYAYADRIGTIPINVSQQPLPKDFADQTSEQVQLFAQGYAANKELDVKDAIVYIGTSAKGPQSVIVVKGKLLILIKASAAIPDSDWQKYIQSLS